MRLSRFALFLLPLLALTLPARAAELVILQSSPLRVYETARTAFLAEFSGQNPTTGPKHILAVESVTLLLSDFPDAETARAAVLREQPRLLLTLGQAALEVAAELDNTPTVFTLAPDLDRLSGNKGQRTGIGLDISAGRQLALLLSRFSFSRPGIIFNQKKAAELVSEAENAATARGLHPVTRQIDHVKEAPGMLKSMAGEIDALWLIPDTSVLTPSTMEYLAFFSLKYKVPIFSFSEKLLRYGASAATVFDIEDMGRQAARLAARILGGTPAGSLPIEEPEKIELQLNEAVLQNLGLNGTTSPLEQLKVNTP